MMWLRGVIGGCESMLVAAVVCMTWRGYHVRQGKRARQPWQTGWLLVIRWARGDVVVR